MAPKKLLALKEIGDIHHELGSGITPFRNAIGYGDLLFGNAPQLQAIQTHGEWMRDRLVELSSDRNFYPAKYADQPEALGRFLRDHNLAHRMLRRGILARLPGIESRISALESLPQSKEAKAARYIGDLKAGIHDIRKALRPSTPQ